MNQYSILPIHTLSIKEYFITHIQLTTCSFNDSLHPSLQNSLHSLTPPTFLPKTNNQSILNRSPFTTPLSSPSLSPSPSPSRPSPSPLPPRLDPRPSVHHRTHSRSADGSRFRSLPFTPPFSPTFLPRLGSSLLLLLLLRPLLRVVHARHLLDLHRRTALDLPQMLAHLLTASLRAAAPTRYGPDTPSSSCSPATPTAPDAACTSARTTR